MTGIAQRRPLTQSLQLMLGTNTGFTWGMAKRPRVETKPYGIIYAMVGEEGWYCYDSPISSSNWLYYQMTMVAETQEQALYASERANDALVGRGPAGWTNVISLPGANLISRELVSAGVVVAGGEQLFSVNDSYKFLVE